MAAQQLEGIAESVDMPTDNITDWCLEQFQSHYSDNSITKDDIWEYLYGVMHAPDWREKYECHLQKNLPRVPFAPDFEAFRHAGRQLMDLHIGYEECREHPDVICEVDRKQDEGDKEPEAYRLDSLKLKEEADTDTLTLKINPRCYLKQIPATSQDYTISGRSPLEWAESSLCHKSDKNTGIEDDPNTWHMWQDEPFELIRHLRRLVWLSTETARIVSELPKSLTEDNGRK